MVMMMDDESRVNEILMMLFHPTVNRHHEFFSYYSLSPRTGKSNGNGFSRCVFDVTRINSWDAATETFDHLRRKCLDGFH
jgi:hypothetical protein